LSHKISYFVFPKILSNEGLIKVGKVVKERNFIELLSTKKRRAKKHKKMQFFDVENEFHQISCVSNNSVFDWFLSE